MTYFDRILRLVRLDHGLSEACVGDGELWSFGGGVGRVDSHSIDLFESELLGLVFGLDHFGPGHLGLAAGLLHL